MSAELGYPDDPEGEAAMGRINEMLAKAEAEFGAMTPMWRSLDMIAIAPERQGLGLGSALLGRLLDDAATAGETLALVTDRDVNVRFYEKAGMELAWSGMSDDGAVPLWSFRKG
jgi:GNAT superfamily N-acetyltransferase